VPDECVGSIMQNLANRKGMLTNMEKHPHSTMIEATITTRGLIGMEIDVVNATSGRGVLSHLFKEYGPLRGRSAHPHHGTLIATEAGETTTYALVMCQERGKLFVGPGEQVYEGMIVGENPRNEDIASTPSAKRSSPTSARRVKASPPVSRPPPSSRSSARSNTSPPTNSSRSRRRICVCASAS
jgi:GTP-binding protein